MKTEVDIRGMHCAGCARRLTDAFEKVPGVRRAKVGLEPPRATLESDGALAVAELERAARGAGDYSVVGVSSDGTAAEGPRGTPEAAASLEGGSGGPAPSLYPLFLIVGYIAGVCALTTYFRGGWSWHTFMNDFMAGFFLVFSFFKLLDLRGFAGAYRTYDVVARAVPGWGLVYPFVELALGAAYLTRFEPVATNWVTLVLMLVGSAGVLRALVRKDAVRCACLGTALNLPMTTVTLVEDVGMAAMAGAMLYWR